MQFTNNDLNNFVLTHINVKKEDLTEYRAQANRLKNNLEEYIKKNPGFALVKMRNSGSVAKGTALKTINDMDIAVYVKADAVGQQESEILSFVHQALINIYTRYNMKEDQFSIGNHCVKVSFRGSGLDVDVVPVIYEGDPDDKGYLISKHTGERFLTSIPLHLDFIRKRKSNQPEYAKMVRITKWWRNQRGFKMKSFLIELIWAHLADTEGISTDIPTALQQFFRYLLQTNLQAPIVFEDYYKRSEVVLQSSGVQIFDPVNPVNNVGISLDSLKLNQILDEADESLGFLSHAIQSSTKTVAESKLKELFGNSFSL
jgi:hypothetical protein